MKYCPHCGNELLDEAMLCPKCGRTLSSSRPAIKPAETVQEKPKHKYTGMSIAGFILAFIFPFVGIVLSAIAYGNAKADGDVRCAVFSKVAIFVSAFMLTLAAASSIVGIFFEQSLAERVVDAIRYVVMFGIFAA